MENFDNITDVLHISILYFIHTFLYSQIRDATISRADFLMVEDGRFDFDKESHRMRYASLFRNYDLRKAQKHYLSDNDDPPRPRPIYVLHMYTYFIFSLM
ncbi:hypothetical protein FXO38_15013, partial [Capsicum annuum]